MILQAITDFTTGKSVTVWGPMIVAVAALGVALWNLSS